MPRGTASSVCSKACCAWGRVWVRTAWGGAHPGGGTGRSGERPCCPETFCCRHTVLQLSPPLPPPWPCLVSRRAARVCVPTFCQPLQPSSAPKHQLCPWELLCFQQRKQRGPMVAPSPNTGCAAVTCHQLLLSLSLSPSLLHARFRSGSMAPPAHFLFLLLTQFPGGRRGSGQRHKALPLPGT